MVFVLWIRLKTSFVNAKVVLLEGCVNFSTLMMMENEFEKGMYFREAVLVKNGTLTR